MIMCDIFNISCFIAEPQAFQGLFVFGQKHAHEWNRDKNGLRSESI